MANSDPVTHARRKTGKRKRAMPGALESSWSSPSDGAMNPFSRSQEERLQLSAAGLSDVDEDPTRDIKDFPHRRFDQEPEPDDDGELQRSDVEDGGAGARLPAERSSARRVAAFDRGGRLDVLVRSIHQLLDRGDIAKAARAYGAVLQLRPGSRPIDVRQHNLWAIGAELLMREGEQPGAWQQPQHQHGEAAQTAGDRSSSEYKGIRMPARWGSPANIGRVRAYFEILIQKHPYDHKFTRSVSALDFQLALLGCEIYNIHAEHTAALARADEDANPWRRMADDVELPVESIDDDVHEQEADEHQARRRTAHKERLRAQARTSMQDITTRMDRLMQQLPYSKNNHFLRLRATGSLYMADLLVPVPQMASPQRYDAENRRRLELEVAIDALHRLVNNGGQLDRVAQAVLDGQNEMGEEPPSPSPLYSSLPIRRT